MDEIFKVHKNLYIGAYWPQLNFNKLKEIGITAIVNLMEMNHYTPPEGFIYLYKGFPDNTYPPHRYLKEILNFIDENIKEGKVLVHCAMGISRSGGIIVAWLLKEHPQWSWSDAINYVWKVRRILPAIEIRESVLDYLESIEGHRRSY
ncbi:MAG: dual specificity protein phosphatase family protein [Candidatus Hermodarchaeota archaeon]